MKGIIVAAGYGTRFLPATKTIAKEMLPLIDKPAIAFIVEEFIASGITDIIVVTSRRKKSMEDYFDHEIELETLFKKENSSTKLEKIVPPKANICFVRQHRSIGSGDALLAAAPWLGGDSAVVAYPDDVHFGEVPLTKQLIEAHQKSGKSICAAMPVEGDVSRYGVFALKDDNKSVTALIEKPKAGTEPSHMVSIGRYLLTNDFFEYLAEQFKNYDPSQGEFYHVSGLIPLIENNQVEALVFSGKRVDTGDPSGYIEAIVTYAGQHPEYSKIIKKYFNS